MITRYSIDNYWRAGSNPQMNEDDSGFWVSYNDHKKAITVEEQYQELLLTELASLKAERDALAQFAETRRVQINELMDEREIEDDKKAALRKEVVQLRSELSTVTLNRDEVRRELKDWKQKSREHEDIAHDVITERNDLRTKLAAFTDGMPLEVIKDCIKQYDEYDGDDIPKDMVVFTEWLRKLAAMQDERGERDDPP